MTYSIEQHHGSYNIQKRTAAVKYIVVHYTGSGTSAAGSAKANCTYFAGGNRSASAHYFIDDATICEYAEPSAYVTWHCGDGKGRYGITNANSVGIEVCNSGGAFSAAEIGRLAWLVQKLMARFGVDAAHVVRHYDASRKRCPAYYVDNAAAWTALHSTITNGGTAAESEDEVTDADIDKIVNKIVTYKVEQMNGSNDLYQLITDIHWQVVDEKATLLDRIKGVTVAYKNKKVNGDSDVYKLLTDIHNAVCKVE
jgi:N-acetylmuramoyl-L-alanine amidase CwlA